MTPGQNTGRDLEVVHIKAVDMERVLAQLTGHLNVKHRSRIHLQIIGMLKLTLQLIVRIPDLVIASRACGCHLVTHIPSKITPQDTQNILRIC